MGSSSGKGGGGGSTINDYYGDVAGIVCNGPVDVLRAIIVDGKTAWTGPLARAGQPNPVAITVEGYGLAYFYWGTSNQELATHDAGSLQVGGSAGVEDVLGPNGHPPYRRQAVMVLKSFLFGREKVSAPSVEVIVGRKPVQSVIVGDAAELDADGQANPLVILAELITDPVFGLGIDPSRLDAPSWQDTADELLARHAEAYISPALERPQSVRSLIDDLREYYDGWFRWTRTGKIAAGRFLRGEAPPAFDTSNTITADDLIEEPSIDAQGWADTSNQVALKFQDSANDYKDSGVTVTNGYSRNVVGEPRQVSVERPHVTRAAQAARQAAEFLRTVGEPTLSGTLTLRGARAAGLPVGAVFKFTHDLLGLNIVARVTGRVTAAPPSEQVKIEFEADKALAVVSTVVGEVTAPPVELDPPERLDLHQFFQPPRALFNDAIPRLCVLAARTNPLTVGYNLHLQQADTSLFQLVGTQSRYAVKGLLNAGYSAALGNPDDNSESLALTLNAGTLAVDLETIGEAQSEDMISDGNLIAVIFSAANPANFEILAVRAGRLSGGSYLLKVRRGQFNTAPRTFIAGDVCWIIHRSKLTKFAHASFPSYADASTTVKFRLQSFTSYAEADLSDTAICPDLSFTFAPVDYSSNGPDDYVIPDMVSSVSVQAGFNSALVTWILPTNVVVARTLIYESNVPVLPGSATAYCQAPVALQWFVGIATPATRYYWLQVQSASGRLSAVAGPYSVAIEGVDVTDFADGLVPVEIVDALPSTGNFKGRVVVLTTDAKLYRWTNDVIGTGTLYWSAAVASTDVTGTLTDAQLAAISAAKITGTLTDAQLSAIAAAKITGQIATTQITDGGITTAKLAANAVTANEIAADAVTAAKILAGAITTSKIAAGAVTAAEISAGAITTAKLAAGAVTANEIAANAITTAKIAADAVTAGAIAAGAITAAKVGTNEIIASAANIGNAVITGAKIANATVATANIADAAITNAKIGALAVDSINLQGNAVTIPVAAFTSSAHYMATPTTPTWETLQTCSITSSGAPIFIAAGFLCVPDYTAPSQVRLKRGASVITTFTPTAFGGSLYLHLQDTPGAGSVTYTLEGLGTSDNIAAVSHRVINLLEVKK